MGRVGGLTEYKARGASRRAPLLIIRMGDCKMTFYRVTVRCPLSYKVRYTRDFKTAAAARDYATGINDDYIGYWKPYIVKDEIEPIEIDERRTYRP